MSRQEQLGGAIVKDASMSKIPERWRPAVTEAVQAYRENLGDVLHSVYVVGSVAKGKPIEGTSDLDTIAFVSTPEAEIDESWVNDVRDQIGARYPFIANISIDVYPLDAIEDSKPLRVLLKLESACAYGEDLALNLPELYPGEETRVASLALKRRVEIALRNLADEDDRGNVDLICRGISRRIIRSGYELVESDEGVYTRELDACCEGFAKYYPEQAGYMRQALEWARHPSHDHEQVRKFVEDFGNWLIREVETKFPMTLSN